MILLDQETTALQDFALAPLEHQPELLEFYGVKYLDKKLDGKAEVLHFLCRPRNPVIPPEVTKITGLSWKDVEKEKGFAFHYPKLAAFFLGERCVVAHNTPYDMSVLQYELMRLGKEYQFPWPSKQICTVEITQHLATKREGGKFFKLDDLYTMLTGKAVQQEHRAKSDVNLLVACCRELMKRGLWPKD